MKKIKSKKVIWRICGYVGSLVALALYIIFDGAIANQSVDLGSVKPMIVTAVLASMSAIASNMVVIATDSTQHKVIGSIFLMIALVIFVLLIVPLSFS